MKMSYSDLLSQFLDNIGQTGATDTNLISFFQRMLAQRYQLCLAAFNMPINQIEYTASTVASQQYYHKPAAIVTIESCTVTVSGISYPVIPIDSLLVWQKINQLLITVTTIPQFIFARRDDFGIWPTPQGIYTITMNVQPRDRDLKVADYTTGTATTSQNSVTVAGGSTSWTTAMIGRWFEITDTTAQDYGYPYRITNVTSTTSLTLESAYDVATATTKTYRIFQTPEIPDEGHIILADGVTSDYFAGPRGNMEKGTQWNNKFWTGDMDNKERDGKNIKGGLIGLSERYSSRTDSAIIRHQSIKSIGNNKLWATTISM